MRARTIVSIRTASTITTRATITTTTAITTLQETSRHAKSTKAFFYSHAYSQDKTKPNQAKRQTHKPQKKEQKN
jgi:hypothetical protein